MPAYVWIIDIFGLVLAVAGFMMAFRQDFVRGLLGNGGNSPGRHASSKPEQDPVTYALRISGMMIMVFGIALGIMVTSFHMA